MNSDFPIPINSESDLQAYENYLTDMDKPKNHTALFDEHFKTLIGYIIKADLVIGNRLESKIGTLESIGEDFFILGIQNQKSIIIKSKSVISITILQKSTKRPL